MKKLLVLALVLSMATMANAALVLTISGPATLAPLAVGTYTIGYTGAVPDLGGFDVDIISDQGAQPFGIGGGVILAANHDGGADSLGINGATGNYEITAESFTMATPVDMGSPLASFTFTAGNTAGTANLSLIMNALFDIGANDISAGAVMSGMAVTVTPEPMTMCLLGLGGLFLRRRSK